MPSQILIPTQAKRAPTKGLPDDAPDAASVQHMVNFTLKCMARGGMYDHVGGGFHRYSVDELWHVPHFEKMLYDNPQLALLYLDLYRITGEPEHVQTVRGVLDYLLRQMQAPEGGIYAAEVGRWYAEWGAAAQ